MTCTISSSWEPSSMHWRWHCDQLPQAVRQYWSIPDQLTLDDNFILCGCRLVTPSISTMLHEILRQLHKSHQGTVHTKQKACLAVYWPGIDNDVDNTILACKQCQDSLPSNPRDQLLSKQHLNDHSSRSRATSAPTLHRITLSWWTATPAGLTSSP